MVSTLQAQLGRKVIQYGFLLFALGLLTGFVIPVMQNTRMGLSSHLEAVMNGMFLILLGLVWHKLQMSNSGIKWVYALALFGTYTNWITTFFAGYWGAGSELMPIAGGALQGTAWQELLIKIGLGSLSLSMLAVCVLVLWGLRAKHSDA